MGQTFHYVYSVKKNGSCIGNVTLDYKRDCSLSLVILYNTTVIKKTIEYAQDNIVVTSEIKYNHSCTHYKVLCKDRFAQDDRGTKCYLNGTYYIKEFVEYVMPFELKKLDSNSDHNLKILNTDIMNTQILVYRKIGTKDNCFILPNGKVVYGEDGIVRSYENYYSKVNILRLEEK